MIKEIRYTLVSDGSSDDALISPLTWLLREQGVDCAILPTWADLSRLRSRPKGLLERIGSSLNLFPCDLLFVHRDAENQAPQARRAEIGAAIEELQSSISLPPYVCAIPVRMTEAWFLFDEQALRFVAENPNGDMPLSLPRIAELENRPDPKEDLYQLLRTASGLHGRRLKRFSTAGRIRRIAERLETFAPLRALSAFRALEAEIAGVVRSNGNPHLRLRSPLARQLQGHLKHFLRRRNDIYDPVRERLLGCPAVRFRTISRAICGRSLRRGREPMPLSKCRPRFTGGCTWHIS